MTLESTVWVHIPTDVAYKMERICAKYFLRNRKCDGCPLEKPCHYKNDPNKSAGENHRIFETGMLSKLAEIEKEEEAEKK